MHSWKEYYGAIYFSLPTVALTGPEWATYLRSQNIMISGTAHDLLFDHNFKPTVDPIGEVVLIRKSQFLGNGGRINMKELLSFRKNDLVIPSHGLGCIMLHSLSLEEIKSMIPVDEKGKRKIKSNLDFNIIIMNPMIDIEKDEMVFYIYCKEGKISLKAITSYSLNTLKGEIAFAFQQFSK